MGYDPLGALRTLDEHGVRYVVIGGVAGRLWGSPTLTNDTDICCAWDPENLARLASALHQLHARLRGVDDDVPFLLDAETLARGRNFTFSTATGALDVMGAPAGVDGFEELAANAVAFDLGDELVVLGVFARRSHPHEACGGTSEGSDRARSPHRGARRARRARPRSGVVAGEAS